MMMKMYLSQSPALRQCLQRQCLPSFQVAFQSSWAAPQRKRQYTPTAPTTRRPKVNGKAVAFHISDLPSPPQQHKPSSSLCQSSANIPAIKPIRDYESDLVVVLDMDECLLHTKFADGPGAKYAYQVKPSAASNGEAMVDTFNLCLSTGVQAKVHERPHLHDFLAKVSEKYETHLFTASMEVYAKAVTKVLDPHGTIFTHCWYRESCQFDNKVGAYVKHLDPIFGDRIRRTVLVDNNPLSFLPNPENGMLVSSFFNDPTDETLPAVLEFLDELDAAEDVRPVLDSRFGLKKALEKIHVGRPFAGRKQQIQGQQEDQGMVATASF
eukprot:Nitzschia sp. Nitz4//scaffold252_size28738//6532//7503//NITZ4_008094-RA/size28738-processed-gene-0.25-mRNA-1//-1//CDS//3329544260//7170//frame0